MTTAAAQTFARKRPWPETKPVRKTGAVPATTPVRTRARSSSFQLKMKQIKAVAAMPGIATGAMTLRRMSRRLAPSIWAASSISSGTSARKDRIIQTAMGRFMDVYIRIRNQMLSRAPTVRAKRYSGRIAATTGIILVERKKNMTSVHFFTGLMESA